MFNESKQPKEAYSAPKKWKLTAKDAENQQQGLRSQVNVFLDESASKGPGAGQLHSGAVNLKSSDAKQMRCHQTGNFQMKAQFLQWP